jgi:hypothetical protein
MPHDLQSLRASLAELGTTKVAHLDGDLLEHMTNVYRSLGRMGRPEHVMLAGLFHGIYGTHALQGTQVFALSDDRRDEVRALIGERAERIVYGFCVMTYESLGKSVRNMMRPGGTPELHNRRTDSPLEVTAEEFTDILWLKFADLLAHVPQLPPETRDAVSADFGPFWRMVAEDLGPAAVAEWNTVFDASLTIQPATV